MTIEQKQCLLRYLGYYTGAIDGVWGEGSQLATIDFQRAYMAQEDVDGIFGAATEKRILEVITTGEKPVYKKSDSTDCTMDYTNVQNNNAGNSTHKNTGTFWDEIEYFDREEFRCQCKGKYCNGFPVEPQEKMVRTVDEIRRRLGVPVTIVESGGSGVRCPVHNANVGGVANSNHLTGNAADLHSGKSPKEMVRVAEEVMGNTGEIGVYDWGIHVGVNCKYSRFYG